MFNIVFNVVAKLDHLQDKSIINLYNYPDSNSVSIDKINMTMMIISNIRNIITCDSLYLQLK